MKKGLVIGVIILVAIILVGGFYFIKPQNLPTQNPVQNLPNETVSPPTTQIVNHSSQNTLAISIVNFAFNPATLTINAGDTVIWTNGDSVQHKVVSDSGNELNSESLSNGATYSHTFAVAGTYDYHCGIHTSMKGKVIVK